MGKYIKPTEKEFEILAVLWQEGSATVKKVHEIFASKTGYTTTLKLMQIMFEKGIVKRDTTTKQHIYKANYTKDQAKEFKVKQILLELFDDDKVSLITYLSETSTTTNS
jgi:predicted transcriptional regulator